MSNRIFFGQDGKSLTLARALPKHGAIITIARPTGESTEIQLDVAQLADIIAALSELERSITTLQAGIAAKKAEKPQG